MAIGDTAESMRAFMRRGGWSFPVVMAVDELGFSYGIRTIPTTVIIDSKGRMVDTIVGVVKADKLASLVEDL